MSLLQDPKPQSGPNKLGQPSNAQIMQDAQNAAQPSSEKVIPEAKLGRQSNLQIMNDNLAAALPQEEHHQEKKPGILKRFLGIFK